LAIPQEIIDEYKLMDMITPYGSIHIEANKGMYGLPQAGLLVNCSKNASMKENTDKANWSQAYGNTNGDQSNSLWLSMALE